MKSRKFWMAVFGCAVCFVMMYMTFDSFDPMHSVLCLAMGALIVVAYLIAQGWEDRAKAVSNLTIQSARGDAYEKRG